jgi:hypothetical protein
MHRHSPGGLGGLAGVVNNVDLLRGSWRAARVLLEDVERTSPLTQDARARGIAILAEQDAMLNAIELCATHQVRSCTAP